MIEATSTRPEIDITLEEGAHTPTYGTDEAAGADIKAHITHPILLAPGERTLVGTGIRIAIPQGYEIQIRPRSGLAFKHGVTILNAPGTIDSDYRGEICALLINHGSETFTIEPGMRIAQLVVAAVIQPNFMPVADLPTSIRGEKGFGHTGLH